MGLATFAIGLTPTRLPPLAFAGPAADLPGVRSLYLIGGAVCCVVGYAATRSRAVDLDCEG